MFGFGLLGIYYFINMIYTLILFIFYHNILLDVIIEKSIEKSIEKVQLTDKQLSTSIHIVYILSAFLGTFFLAFDLLKFILNPKNSFFIKRFKKDKKK